jgi:adenosylmethionine-8-amino-7-oxononanoate aminotransferase
MSITNEHVFFRGISDTTGPIINRASGIYCFDADGRRYIDAVSGVGNVCIGQGVREIIEAATRQMEKTSFAHPLQWQNEPQMQLAQTIASLAPPGLSKVFLCSGGSEATETAIKMARQYHVERGQRSKYKIIGRWHGYHGNTLGALAASGMVIRRALFAPLLGDFPHIVACNCYRCPFGKSYPGCGIACAHELEAELLRQGPENVAAFIAEPFVGTAGGALGAPPEYFRLIRDICDRYDILLIVDEVITGFGRTGRNFAIDHWGVIPDLICTGKGMSGGYTPLGGVIARSEILDVFQRGHGFEHGYTYGGNPLSCAVGNAVLEYIVRRKLIEHVAALEGHFFSKARELEGLDIVGEVRGRGFMLGVELVADSSSRRPFDRAANVATQVMREAWQRGLIVGRFWGQADGVHGEGIMLLPPYVCDADTLTEIIDILKAAILEVRNRIQR